MSGQQIVYLSDVALITCIVQRGAGEDIVRAAQGAGAQGATVYFAKGGGIRERLGVLGVAVEVEKEVVNIIVSSHQKEAVFNSIYLAGKLDTPGMGIAFITPLDKAATYVPPDVLERLQAKEPGAS